MDKCNAISAAIDKAKTSPGKNFLLLRELSGNTG